MRVQLETSGEFLQEFGLFGLGALCIADDSLEDLGKVAEELGFLAGLCQL